MSFKVVHIKELDEIEPVPHLWEENGLVYWPHANKDRRKFQSLANSEPDKQNWLKYRCVVKEIGIQLYAHASARADFFCSFSNTESEQEFLNRNANRPNYQSSKVSGFDYELLMAQSQVNNAHGNFVIQPAPQQNTQLDSNFQQFGNGDAQFRFHGSYDGDSSENQNIESGILNLTFWRV